MCPEWESCCNSYKEQSPVNSKKLKYFQSSAVITGQDRPESRAQETKIGHSPSPCHPRCSLSPGCPASPTLNVSLTISPSSPQFQTSHFLYLGVVTENPKTILIHGEVESTNTPSLNPKIILAGQILASSRDQGPQLGLAPDGESRRPLGSLSSNLVSLLPSP